MENELIVKAYWFDQLSDLVIAKSIIAKQQQEIAAKEQIIAELQKQQVGGEK